MKYNINNENLSKVLSNIKTEINNNRDIIKELIEIDSKNCKMKISLEELENLLEKMRNEKIDLQNEQTVKMVYNGNPYITLNLSILAILTKTIVIFEFNQFMLGINTFIIQIVNDVLNKFKTNKLVYLSDKNNQNQEEIDKIICIDDINQYNAYLLDDNSKVKFYSFNYLDFYSDSHEFEGITELIYRYAEDNQIAIESYSELEPDEAANMIQNGIGKALVLLTNREETKQIFKSKITNKKIYINQNPFIQEINLIDKEIFI